MSFVVTQEARIFVECAHWSPGFGADHPNSRIHGHSYELRAKLRGAVNPKTGFLVDHGLLEKALQSVGEELDHRLLNDVPGLEFPSGEHMARWVYLKLKPQFASLESVVVARPSIGALVEYAGDRP